MTDETTSQRLEREIIDWMFGVRQPKSRWQLLRRRWRDGWGRAVHRIAMRLGGYCDDC